MSFDSEEQKRRIRELKEKLLEAVDFLTTWQEQEARKRSATETDFQNGEGNIE